MTEKQFLIKFDKFIKQKYKTRVAASKAWGCSPMYVTYCAAGDRTPTDAMLEDMRLTRHIDIKVTYEKTP